MIYQHNLKPTLVVCDDHDTLAVFTLVVERSKLNLLQLLQIADFVHFSGNANSNWINLHGMVQKTCEYSCTIVHNIHSDFSNLESANDLIAQNQLWICLFSKIFRSFVTNSFLEVINKLEYTFDFECSVARQNSSNGLK